MEKREVILPGKKKQKELSKQIQKPKKKKSNWMSGFVIGKPTSEIDKVRYESMAKVQDLRNKLIKYK